MIINEKIKYGVEMKTLKILILSCLFICTTLLLRCQNIEEQNEPDSSYIYLINPALSNVIDEFIDNLQLKSDKYIISLQMQRSEDVFIVQLLGSRRSLPYLFALPPSQISLYKNHILLIYLGFENFFYFPKQLKESIGKYCLPTEYRKYIADKNSLDIYRDTQESWIVKIKNDKIIYLQKHVFEGLFWR